MKRYNWCRILLVLVIVAQISYTTYVFAFVKQGNHSDEAWTYGLSNSYYHPFFSIEDGIHIQAFLQHEALKNQWIPGRVFRDYLTVQKGEQFAYGSVYYNNTFDVHPPLYHMLLHTICSFFPDSFSWWYGFALNMMLLIATQIFLYLLAKKVSRSEYIALMTCLFYAGGMGTLCNFSFIRHYTLLTLLCVMFAYFCACYYEELLQKGKISRKYMIASGVCACAAFLTHYIGIVFLGIYTAVFCIMLLAKKKIYPMFMFGCSIVIGLESFFVIYPSAIFDVLVDDGKPMKHFSPAVQIRMLFRDIFQYNYGFKIGYFPTAFWNITIPLVFAVLVMTVALLFPFRNEIWFGRLIAWLKRQGEALLLFLKNANYIPLVGVVSAWGLMKWVAQTTDVYALGRYAMRYTYNALPFFAFAFVFALSVLLKQMFKALKWRKQGIKIILVVVILGILVKVSLSMKYPFMNYTLSDGQTLAEMVQGKNVLVIEDAPNVYCTSSAMFAPAFMNAKQVRFTIKDVLQYDMMKPEKLGEPVDCVIVLEYFLQLTDEEKEKIDKWARAAVGKKAEEDSSGDEAVVSESDQGVIMKDERDEDKTCMDIIADLSETGEHELIGYLTTQSGYFCVLELK